MRKDELVEDLKNIINVKWEKMSYNDLKKVYDFFDKPENIVNLLIDTLGIENFVKVVNECIAVKVVKSKPLRKIIKQVIFGDK